MKITLLVGVLLLCASGSSAQGFRSGGGGGWSGGGGWNGGGNWGGGWGYGCAWCYNGLDASSSFTFGSSGVRYEPPATFEVSYATNDGDYIPSIYMNYQDALELGRQQLAAIQRANEHPVSLGEIARAYRSNKRSDVKLPRLNDLNLQSVVSLRTLAKASAPQVTNTSESPNKSRVTTPSDPSVSSAADSRASSFAVPLPSATHAGQMSPKAPVRLAAVQDNSGRLQVCEPASGTCHYPR